MSRMITRGSSVRGMKSRSRASYAKSSICCTKRYWNHSASCTRKAATIATPAAMRIMVLMLRSGFQRALSFTALCLS